MPTAGWLSTFTDLIFPPRCIYCGRIGSEFCAKCRATATPVGDDICVRCGQPTTRRCTCHICKRTPPWALRGMRGAVFYGGTVAFAIHGLKYRGKTQLARPLSSYLLAYLDAHPISIDCLIPVPLHAERLAFRGYNQSDLLAAEVGRARGIPVRADLIERTRHTAPQVHLKRKERLENVRDAFAPRQTDAFSGETVLLIDDVCTTGATLIACAEAVRQAGAGDIWALTVARARPPVDPEPWQEGLAPAEVFIAWDGMVTR